MAQLADAEGLKPSDPQGSYGFDPRPGHALNRENVDFAVVAESVEMDRNGKTRTKRARMKTSEQRLSMARGSVTKRNNGYAYRIDRDADPVSGKCRQSSRQGFKNKKEAERALEEHLGRVRSGTHVDKSKLTTADYLDQWRYAV